MPKRTRLTTGIYQDAYGLSVITSEHGRAKEMRFAPGTPLERLKKWRRRRIGQLADLDQADPRGSLARDVVEYLKRLKGQPSYKSEKSHLRAWLHYLPRGIRRWAITRKHVELAIAEWREQGYAARTIRHRCRVLEALYHRLDGSRSETPLDDVVLPAKPKPRPVSVSDTSIATVALELRKHETLGWLRDSRTRARFLVLATHQQRPIEVQRTERIDLDLDRRLWFVRGAKGGYSAVVPLNEEQLAAWQLFIAGQAWGRYDSRSFAKTIQRAGWPKGIRPYNLRHSTAFALTARDVDLGDVQSLLGHTSPATTRMYTSTPMHRLKIASQKLEGRFSPLLFTPALPRPTPKKATLQSAKGQEKTGKNEAQKPSLRRTRRG